MKAYFQMKLADFPEAMTSGKTLAVLFGEQ